jgi:hypothetical protein
MAEAPRPSREQLDFLEESIRAIASVKSSPDDHAWWATWLAAKNPFISELGGHFEQIWKSGSTRKKSTTAFAGRLFRSVYRGLKFSVKLWLRLPSLHRSFATRIETVRSDSRKAYVIKTFAYPGSFEKSADGEMGFADPFFPGLREYLEKKDFNVVTIIHSIGALDEATRLGPSLATAVFPYQVFVRRSDLIKAFIRILTACFRRFAPVHFRGQNVTPLLRRQYLLDLCSASGVEHFLYLDAFERVAQLFGPTHFAMTLENNPFERMCVSAIRKKSPGTKIVGYHHATINMSALNMYPAIGELARSPCADLLLTVGEEPAANLRHFGHYDIPKPEIRAACALRYRYLEKLSSRVGEPRRVLLAILDGVPQARQQVEQLLGQMASLKGWRVILREHPAMTLQDLKIDLARLNGVAGLEISKGPLKQDLDRAGAVLFRESTVALEAIALGIPVVHWDSGQILSNDPLFYCMDYKWTVSKGSDLSQTLEKICSLSVKDLESSHQEAMKYLRRYFHPVTDVALENFL